MTPPGELEFLEIVMRFRNTIGARLALAFACVIIVFVAAVALSIGRLSAFNAAVNQITGPGLTKLEMANAWSIRLLQTAHHTRNMLILDDKNKIQAEVDAVMEDKLQRKAYREALTAISSSAAETAALQAVADSRVVYVPFEDEFLRDVSAGQLKEAKEVLLERARPAQLAYLDALGKYREFQKSQILGQAAALSASYQSSRSMLITLSLGAVAISCLLAYLITRGIRNPLLKVIAHFQEMRQGNFKSQIEVTSQDEIGQVLGALKTTQRTLLDSSVQAADYQGQIAALGKAQAVIEFELDGTVRTANDNFLRVLGLGLDDVKGKNHSMFVEPGYRDSADDRQFWDKLRRGEHETGIFKRMGQGGREVWLQASYNPIVGLDGKPYKVVKYATDVTDQVRMKKGLDDAITEQAQMKKGLDDAVTETQAVVQAAIDGDLTGQISMAGKSGQIEALSASVNALLGSMADVIRTMNLAATEVWTGAEEISRGNADLSRRTGEQASSLEETSSSMEEMTSTVKNNADNAARANQLAAATRAQAERGGSVVGAAVAAMGEINASSKRIADIIGVIDAIAFQTNLLALNAAVEAARAGEQGRGFAVVASEVRNLASRSAGAAKEIKGLIQDSVGKVAEGTKLVDESGKVLQEIVIGVKKVTEVVAEIASSSREQAAGIEQVNKTITMMDDVTQQNAALVEEASAAAQALTEQATNLTQLIARYRVREESAGKIPRAAKKPAVLASVAMSARARNRHNMSV
jgi:methyl-accepting chemotaxis protein